MRLRPALDADTRAYWDGRDSWGFRRAPATSPGGLHRHGLLGRFIAAGHAIARLQGGDLSAVLRARTPGEQREAFERHVAPLFDRAAGALAEPAPRRALRARHPAGAV